MPCCQLHLWKPQSIFANDIISHQWCWLRLTCKIQCHSAGTQITEALISGHRFSMTEIPQCLMENQL